MAHAVTDQDIAAGADTLCELARDNFTAFCKLMLPAFTCGKHTHDLITALHGVESGKIKRLLVTEPPRHGKSLLVSQLFPCWFLGRNPEADVIQSGYSYDISIFHSRKARDFMASAMFHAIFPGVAHEPGRPAQDVIDVAKQAAHEWGTRQGGRYYAVGIGGGIAGRGGDVCILDDPLKNREEANSSVIRAKVLDWYRSTFYTRLSPQGRIVLVTTRWHRDDLAGTLLKEMAAGGEQWTVLNCKAIQDDGTALWPERWPIERLRKIRTAIGSFEWSALFQQEPKDPESGMFQRQWFKIVDQAPDADVRWCRFWDLAATVADGSSDPDWTAGALVGLKGGQWIVRDIRRIRATPKNVEDLVRQCAYADPHGTMIRMEQEGGSSGKSLVDHYARHVLTGQDFKGVVPIKSKEVRAGPLSSAAEAGNVVLVQAPWNTALLDELETFPGGNHDDQCDAVSGAMGALTTGAHGMAGSRYGDGIGGRLIERGNERRIAF